MFLGITACSQLSREVSRNEVIVFLKKTIASYILHNCQKITTLNFITVLYEYQYCLIIPTLDMRLYQTSIWL